MYNYEQHFINMVSNCCGDTMEEINEFCYDCDARATKKIVDQGTYCETCKEERDVCEKTICNSCNEICQPIEDYEYNQIRRDERREQSDDR